MAFCGGGGRWPTASASLTQIEPGWQTHVMNSSAEDEIINLSKQKWDWMSAQDVAPLAALFNEAAVFVHVGATFSKEQELDVIKTGRIHYRDVDIKDVDIKDVSVRFIGSTTIVLTTLQLGSVVDGNEVSTPSSSPRSMCNKPTCGPWHRCPSRDSSRTARGQP
jgi:hypothetical protein